MHKNNFIKRDRRRHVEIHALVTPLEHGVSQTCKQSCNKMKFGGDRRRTDASCVLVYMHARSRCRTGITDAFTTNVMKN